MNKHLLLTIFCLLQFAFYNMLQAQNLVPNPSFEEYTTCPNDYYILPTDWYTCSGDPDYFNACDVSNTFGVPENWAGYQKAANGNAYCGFASISFASVPYYKEYLGCHLNNPLTIGVKYYVSMKVSFSFGLGIEMAANNIGLLFSTKSYQDIDPYNNPWNIPTINFAHVVDTNIVSDSINWTTINGCIIADSAYQYVLIGDFFDSTHTNTIKYSPYISQQYSYYYVDDVYVSKDSITSIVNYQENQPTIDIFPNPASDKISFQISEPYKQCNITITDILGKEVQKRTLIYPEKDIALNEINSGIYFIKVEVNNKTVTKKIVVEK